MGKTEMIHWVAVNRLRQELGAFASLHVLPANHDKKRADERTRTADLISLRVISQALQGFAALCKPRVCKRFSLPSLAQCCTALRSRWCQSGVNIALVFT
jgi:hypothetical protein